MLNMLVIEDNITQCKQLVNFISSSISNIKLYSMTFNGNEALNIIKKEKIDIILLDLILPDISGIKILEYIEKNNLFNYKNSIIIISGEANLHPELFKNPYIYSCFQKPIDFDSIIHCLEKIINDENTSKKELIIKEKINIELNKLNFNFSYVGTKYLSECIYELYKRELSSFNLSKDIYPIIARKYSTSHTNIKCNIFQATLNSYYDCEQYKLEKYFGRYFLSKPKTKDIIYKVLENIKK